MAEYPNGMGMTENPGTNMRQEPDTQGGVDLPVCSCQTCWYRQNIMNERITKLEAQLAYRQTPEKCDIDHDIFGIYIFDSLK